MLRVLLVDDEQPARERLRRLLAPFEDVEVVGEAGSFSMASPWCWRPPSGFSSYPPTVWIGCTSPPAR